MIPRKPQPSPWQQAAWLARHWPSFTAAPGHGVARCRGTLQPLPNGTVYKVCIEFKGNTWPKAWVVTPLLTRREPSVRIPHTYDDVTVPGGCYPCLWLPIAHELALEEAVHEKIVPWLAEWLFHYEMWRVTGKWLGGGEHPGSAKRATRTTK